MYDTRKKILVGNTKELKYWFDSFLENHPIDNSYEINKKYKLKTDIDLIDEVYNASQNFGIYFYVECIKDSDLELKSEYFYNTESRPLTVLRF